MSKIYIRMPFLKFVFEKDSVIQKVFFAQSFFLDNLGSLKIFKLQFIINNFFCTGIKKILK